MSGEEKPLKDLEDVWNEMDNQGIQQLQVNAESSAQPKVYGSRKNSYSSYEAQNDTGYKAIISERLSFKASRDESGYCYDSWADRSFPSTGDRTEDSDDPSETQYDDVAEHVESERESLIVCQAALSFESNHCQQLGNSEWLQEGLGKIPCNGKRYGKKDIPGNFGKFSHSENAASKTSDNKIKIADGERVYHCPSNDPKRNPMSLHRPRNAAELGKNLQPNNNFKSEETMVRYKQDKDMLNNQLALHKLNPYERYHQETFYDRNVHKTQQISNLSETKIHKHCKRNEEPEHRIQSMEPNSTTETKRNEEPEHKIQSMESNSTTETKRNKREHMKTSTQSKVYGSRRNITTSREPSRNNHDYFRNNAAENEDNCTGNIQWKDKICNEFENYYFGRGKEYVNWRNNQPDMKSGNHSGGYVEDRHQNKSSTFPTDSKKRSNEHAANYDETMRSRSPHTVHHVIKHEVQVIHTNGRTGYRSKHRDNVPECGDMQTLNHKQEKRKSPPIGMDNFTWTVINLKKQLKIRLEETNAANAKEKNFATAEEKNIATANEKKNVAKEGNNNTVKDDNIYQTRKVVIQQKPKIYSVRNSGAEKRQNKCDAKENSEFKFYYPEKVDEKYSNHAPANKKNALAKRQLLINYGKEISNLVSGCHTAMQLHLSLYQTDWIDARHQSIKLLYGLIKDVTESTGGCRMRDFFRYIGLKAKVVAVAPVPAPRGQIVNVVATISAMLSKYFGSSPTQLDQRRVEMLRSFQLDDDVSNELYMYGMQCDLQMMDTRKLIEEFHHVVVEPNFSDIELQQRLRKFLQETAGFDTGHPSFPRQFYLALRRLKEECPATDDDVYRAFCSRFDGGPEQMKAMKFLNWRCCVVDAAADGAHTKGWEEIGLLLQSTTPSNKAELLKKLEDCTRVLMKEERIYQKVFQSLDEYK